MNQERTRKPRDGRQDGPPAAQRWRPVKEEKSNQQPRRQEPRAQRAPKIQQQQQPAKKQPERPAKQEIYTAPCSICGQDAVLRFKPTGLLPVYCKVCFEVKMNEKENPGTREPGPRKQEKHKLDLFESTPIAPREEPVREEAVRAPVAREPVVRTPVVREPVVRTLVDGESSFDEFNLDPRLARAVQESGYEVPTPVQSATIPLGMSGRDLIGTAQTGTGKTAAFVLPILQHLLDNPSDGHSTRVLVLTPTRELAEQINQSFKQLGRHTKIRTATVYGGVGMDPQARSLRGGVEVIVACPGRLLDHMDRGNTNFANVENLVLDEADRMLDMGFLPQIKRVLAQLPKSRQTMLFSATFAPELTRLASEHMSNAQRVDVDLCAPPKTISHALYPCPQHLKTKLVLKLLDKTDTNSVLIFTRTKHRANRVAKQISAAGYEASALHSNKSQNQRQSALDEFRAGRCHILVATDIAARGLDVETISHVINYDIPDTADTYIHRIGRTGRAEREGDAMTLITKDDTAMVFDIEKALGAPIERRKLDDFDYSAAAPARDEFKRDPLPPRRPRPEAARPKAAVEPKPAPAPGSADANPLPKRPRRNRGPRRPRPEAPSNN